MLSSTPGQGTDRGMMGGMGLMGWLTWATHGWGPGFLGGGLWEEWDGGDGWDCAF